MTSHVQVHDAVTFFQHAGMVMPADCVAFLSTCRKAVQSMQRTRIDPTGALQSSLAQAVDELLQEAASPFHVEACHPLLLYGPSNYPAGWLLAVVEFVRTLAAAVAPLTGLPVRQTMRVCNATR
jgi:hypothetical protein